MLRSLFLAIVLVFVAWCGSDPSDSPGAADTGVSSDMGADALTPRPDAGPSDMAADVQMMPDLSQDMGRDTGRDAGMIDPVPRLVLLTDRHWVGLDIQDDSVGLECVYLDENGAALEAPADLEITIEGEAATSGPDGRWTFSDYGVFTARCSSQSLGLAT